MDFNTKPAFVTLIQGVNILLLPGDRVQICFKIRESCTRSLLDLIDEMSIALQRVIEVGLSNMSRTRRRPVFPQSTGFRIFPDPTRALARYIVAAMTHAEITAIKGAPQFASFPEDAEIEFGYDDDALNGYQQSALRELIAGLTVLGELTAN